jgi:hypothetical protein
MVCDRLDHPGTNTFDLRLMGAQKIVKTSSPEERRNRRKAISQGPWRTTDRAKGSVRLPTHERSPALFLRDAPGMRVKVLQGPLQDQIGLLGALRPHERVLVLLQLLGGERPVELCKERDRGDVRMGA